MTNERPDSIFKLRLTGVLRDRLEEEAAKRGLTLTAEILRRIDETFSDSTERLHNIEKIVFDGTQGNDALFEQNSDIYKELSSLQREISEIKERLSIK
jgi:hypothetical protein